MSLKLDSGRDRQIWVRVKSESWRDKANKGKVRELERRGE